jgi:RHS repeat-associated protein
VISGFRRRVAATTTLVVAGALLQATPVQARDPEPARLKPAPGVSIAGRSAKPVRVTIPQMPEAPARTPTWPAAGRSVIDVPAKTSAAVAVKATRTSMVSISAADRRAKRIAVEVLDRAATAKARRDLVMRLQPDTSSSTGKVNIKIDYRGFAEAYGADWSDRLRLVTLPACALSTPEATGCAGTPLATVNDGTSVSAVVPVADAGTVTALEAGTAGSSGDFQATSLTPSATWTGGGNSGAFTWSYPMRVPPSLGGPAPDLTLSYSSQAVDGRTAVTNNQPSWIGEGFGYEPGFIERRYVPCSEDNDDPDRPANNSAETGDLCWGTDNATLSLDGVGGGELIYNATEKRWHTRSDDGLRIERVLNAANGDSGEAGKEAGGPGEHWVVTAMNGTKYYFGLNRLPGWTINAAETKSVFTVPVAGNQSGDPCRKTAFKDSFCNQAWRWNLDWVVDARGNAESFWYNPETNKYGRNNTATDVQTYVRGGNVERIRYGQTASSAYATAPMSVVFATADRCLTTCTTKSNWQDTPLDQECTGTSCTQRAPSFWTKRRLATVTTQIQPAGATTPRNVERWTLTHTWPDPGDGTRKGMWLSTIGHTGWDSKNVATSVPNVTFVGVPMDNRIDTSLSNGLRPMRWLRMKTIYTETQGTVDITYKSVDCTAAAKPDPATNTKRCFPVRWAPPDLGDVPGKEITDWFHKYVVESVRETDKTSPAQGYPLSSLTTYTYDTPAWRYADDDGLTKDKYRTWSQWRGYSRVTVIIGEGAERSRTDTRFFRGMDGDKATTGKKQVDVTDSKGKATIADADDLAGHVRETVVYNGPDGEPLSGTINDPWLGPVTATRTIGGVAVNARYVDTAGVWNWTARDKGRSDTWTHTRTEFGDYGLPRAVTEFGDTDKSGDERCVLTDYASDDSAKWMLAYPWQTRTFALTCDEARRDGRVIARDEVIDATRTSYDGQTPGRAPTRGLVTVTDMLDDWTNNAPVYVPSEKNEYDTHGRERFSWDALDHKTETKYTPATGGPLTRIEVVNPANWPSHTDIDPANGTTTRSSDVNGRVTEMLYDGLGRLTGVWKPGRSSANTSDIPDLKYTYELNTTKASVVRAEALNAAGKTTVTYAFYDSLLRPIQTQTPSATVGMLVSDTFYDTAGRPHVKYGPYWVDNKAASNALFQPPMPAGRDNVPSWSRTIYDGAGRVTDDVFFSKLSEKWRTTTSYGGDYVRVVPPEGGVIQSTHTDPLGRTTEIRQYKTRDLGGSYDRTTYGYNKKGLLERVTNPRETTWQYGYDVRGRQNYVKDPDRGETRTRYDRLDRIETVTDAKQQVLAYKYDELSRKRELHQGSLTGPKLADWTYDTLTGGRGILAASTRYAGGDPAEAYTSATTALDAKTGRPTTTEISVPASQNGLAGKYTYLHRYAADGTPRLTALPAVGGTAGLPSENLTTGFSDLGLPTTVSTTVGGSIVPAVTFTEYGELSSVVYAQSTGRSLQVLNDYYADTRRLRANQVIRSVGTGVVSWKTYEYHDAGPVKKTREEAAVAGAETQCWRQDHLQRLTDAWTPANGNCDTGPSLDVLADTTSAPAPYWTSWSIDDAGNRTRQVEHKTPAGTRTTDYQYPAPTADHPHALTGTVTTTAGGTTTAEYQIDELGNTTGRPTPANGRQTLTWDIEGRVASVQDQSGRSSYLYDADGNRIIAKDATGTTLYLPGQEIRADLNGVVQDCTRYYSHAGKTVAQRTPAGLTWLVSDTQNTASIAVDAVSQDVTVRHLTPYGEPRDGAAGWVNDKGFLGKTVDPTGLTHVGAREYDPAVGRFISVDPLMDLSNPQQMQGYSYANNSPVSFSDPDGLIQRPERGGGDRRHAAPPPPGYTGPETEYFGGSSGGTAGRGRSAPERESGTKRFVKTFFSDLGGAVTGTWDLGWTSHKCTYQLDKGACQKLVGAGVAQLGFLKDAALCSTVLMAVGDPFGGCRGTAEKMGCGNGLTAECGAHITSTVVIAVATRGVGRLTKAPGGAPKGCPGHSFAAATPVLMADGTTKEIAEVQIGDVVLATDPETGETYAREVVELHENDDTDLTDLTVTIENSKWVTVKTTQNHPFWSTTRAAWVDASKLKIGEQLRSSDGSVVEVAFVRSYLDRQVMHDLTVDMYHTYYVLAGTTPVLVHNCGGDVPAPSMAANTLGPHRPAGVGDGWTARTADNGKGSVWQAPGATGNADMVRTMNPTPRYPNGYVRFYNKHGQPIGLNGKPGSKAETHIPMNPDSTYPLPTGW